MDSLPRDYLQREYELRVNYLKDDLSRMWTRFNFFLTINTGLFAIAVAQSSQELWLLAGILGIVMSVCWNQFAATDNYLVDVYRNSPCPFLADSRCGIRWTSCRSSSTRTESVDVYRSDHRRIL